MCTWNGPNEVEQGKCNHPHAISADNTETNSELAAAHTHKKKLFGRCGATF